jgi:hypothetical protein
MQLIKALFNLFAALLQLAFSIISLFVVGFGILAALGAIVVLLGVGGIFVAFVYIVILIITL